MNKIRISPWQSIAAGVMVNLALILILVPLGTVLLNAVVPFIKYGFYFYSLPLAVILITVFGFGGKRSIKPFHEAVLHILGAPSPKYVLTNGAHWIFSGVFSLREVDMREDEITIERVKTFTKPPDPVRLWFNLTVPYTVVDSYNFLTVAEGKLVPLLKQLAEKVLQIVSRQMGFDEALGMQAEFNRIFNQICSHEKTPDKEKTTYGITDEEDEATKRWGIKVGGAFLSDPELDPKVVEDLEKGRREKLQRLYQRTEAAHRIEMINSYQGDPLQFEEEGVDPVTHKTVTRPKSVTLKTPLGSDAAVLLHQTGTNEVVKTVDEKRIVIPEESRGVIEGILTALLGRTKEGR